MAQMYPAILDPKTESDAEKLLYAALRNSLDHTYTVFHSVAWHGVDGEGRPRDGEADFIIAHPSQGILILEVKGGTIAYDPRARQWTSIGRGGRVHDIKDPERQARNSKHSLLDSLERMFGSSVRRANVGHAVAFPDTVCSQTILSPALPRELIMDAVDLADVKGWVDRVLTHWRGKSLPRETAPGSQVMDALMNLLGKEWELRPALWGDFAQEREALIQLTHEQYTILDTLSRQRRAAICGCAGSGKTMLAVEKASRLARQGFQVLLTCYNKQLAADLRQRLKAPANLTISHFHELCYDLVQQAGVAVPGGQDTPSYFKQALPQALLTALDHLDVRFDAIVVDEAQDFEEEWWIPLQMLLHDPDRGILYIFFDDNQRIYVPSGTFPIQQEPYPLTINCRNTQRIHKQVLRFYDGDVVPTARGPLGRPVSVQQYSAGQLPAHLAQVLTQLTQKEGIPTDEILVLTPYTREKSRLWTRTAGNAITLTDKPFPKPSEVQCTTIQSFKGLERAVIILTEIERWPAQGEMGDKLDKLLYVACSRARSLLVVLLSADAPRTALSLFT